MKPKYLVPAVLMFFLAGCVISLQAAELDGPLENIALNRAACQSDSADDDHTAHLVTDGSPKTYWQSRPGRMSWLSVNFGERCPFDRVVLNWGSLYATAFRLEVSDDEQHPQTWKEIYAVTNGVGGRQDISLPSVTARHLRVVITAYSSPNQGCILSEVEVYGRHHTHFTPATQPEPAADGSVALAGANYN